MVPLFYHILLSREYQHRSGLRFNNFIFMFFIIVFSSSLKLLKSSFVRPVNIKKLNSSEPAPSHQNYMIISPVSSSIYLSKESQSPHSGQAGLSSITLSTDTILIHFIARQRVAKLHVWVIPFHHPNVAIDRARVPVR